MLSLRTNPSRLLFFAVLFLLSVTRLQAQEDEGIYILYYEDSSPNRLDILLLMNNVCLEAVLRLNPDLDMNNIPYGEPIRIPVDERCYQYPNGELYPGWNFSDGNPPRLKYYENGQWLAEPYYSDDVVYIRPYSLDAIVEQYNICLDDLLADNILLQDFERYQAYIDWSMDVFISEDAPTCPPEPAIPIDPVTLPVIELSINRLTPLFSVLQYNLCPETIWQLSRQYSTFTFNLPEDTLPCYNDAGQRLTYIDQQGQLLTEPVYSDLAVALTLPEETMPDVAKRLDVCLVDLLRVNHFPDMPLGFAIELFIPPSRPCPDDIQAILIDSKSNELDDISLDINVCPEVLLALNPHFKEAGITWFLDNWIYRVGLEDNWLLIPKPADPCYWQYYHAQGVTIFDIERQLNVCYQEFLRKGYNDYENAMPLDRNILYIPFTAPPCYNDRGQRLRYPTIFARTPRALLEPPPLEYSDMLVHPFRREDTVYSISQEYNVCVQDLLIANPILVSRMPTDYPTVIPQTRPCYDEVTRMPLLYEDANGVPLDPPQVSDHLIYYGSQPWGYVASYYNICENRIRAANQAKFDRKASYLGWIIPTDRPPCFDADGSPIDYVCYDQPVDFTVDYRNSPEQISFDQDGTYCYNLAERETVIWQQNKPYQVINHFDTLLTSRAFTAWCFGVSLEEMNAINEDPAILELLPFQSRAIPLPTRQCYLQNPHILDGYDLHRVEADETLRSIARQYDKPYQVIAEVNDLDSENLIWSGQLLIIPAGPTLGSVFVLVSRMLGLVVLLLGGWYWRKRR